MPSRYLLPSARVFGLAVLLFAFAACAGPREARDDRSPAADEPAPAAVDLSAVEDFDPSPYAEPAPEGEAEVEHDVPERLMGGRATASTGATATGRGFRLQVYSTLDKRAADNLEEQAKTWWRGQQGAAPAGLFPDQLPVYTVYRQPYYRVRIGNFRTRSEAERARSFVKSRFPDAFIVPDTVTLTR